MEHVLTATVFPHPSGRQFAKQPITFYIPTLELAPNKADELNTTLRKSLGVTEDPPIFIRLSIPAAVDQDGCCEYAAMSAGNAMDWLLSTAKEQQKDGPSWQDGRPALWVMLPALVPPEPTATAAAAASSSASAAARSIPTNSSSGQHSTPTGVSLHQHGGKQAAVGDTEVVCLGLTGTVNFSKLQPWQRATKTGMAEFGLKVAAGSDCVKYVQVSAKLHVTDTRATAENMSAEDRALHEAAMKAAKDASIDAVVAKVLNQYGTHMFKADGYVYSRRLTASIVKDFISGYIFDVNQKRTKKQLPEETKSISAWLNVYARRDLNTEPVKWRSDLHKCIMDGKVHEKVEQALALPSYWDLKHQVTANIAAATNATSVAEHPLRAIAAAFAAGQQSGVTRTPGSTPSALSTPAGLSSSGPLSRTTPGSAGSGGPSPATGGGDGLFASDSDLPSQVTAAGRGGLENRQAAAAAAAAAAAGRQNQSVRPGVPAAAVGRQNQFVRRALPRPPRNPKAANSGRKPPPPRGGGGGGCGGRGGGRGAAAAAATAAGEAGQEQLLPVPRGGGDGGRGGRGGGRGAAAGAETAEGVAGPEPLLSVGGEEDSDDEWDEELAQQFLAAPDAEAAALLMQMSGQQEPQQEPRTTRKRKQPLRMQEGVNLQDCVLDAELSKDQQRVAQAKGESVRAAQTAAAPAKNSKGPGKRIKVVVME